MDKKKITRLMINTAVTRGIEQMADDSHRALRNLADLGKQFSTGRFQNEIIEIIQTTLSNENTPYYSVLEDFLANTDHGIVKNFGINLGYESWTYGARIIRQKSSETGIFIPCTIIFRYAPDFPGKMTADTISRIIKEARLLGINTFCIMQKSGRTGSDDIIRIFEENSECSFFYFLEDSELTTSQIAVLKKCANTLICVNADLDMSPEVCSVLRQSQLLYGVYHFYKESDEEEIHRNEIISRCQKNHSGMLFLIKSDSCTTSFGEYIKQLRLEGRYPCFLWDVYYDLNLIGEILTDNRKALLEFSEDGSVRLPRICSFGPEGKIPDLMTILKQVMPPFPAS
jgi:hypothetical protein